MKCAQTWVHVAAAALVATSVLGCGGGSPEAAFQRGQKMLKAGDRKKAVAAFTEAINIDPKYEQAYTWRGVAYNEMGDHKKALADFTSAIKLGSRDSYPYEQRAQIYRKALHDEAKAKADDETAASLREKRWEDLKKLRKRK